MTGIPTIGKCKQNLETLNIHIDILYIQKYKLNDKYEAPTQF